MRTVEENMAIVKKSYPEAIAVCYPSIFGKYWIHSSVRWEARALGEECNDAEAAWADAAQRIRKDKRNA